MSHKNKRTQNETETTALDILRAKIKTPKPPKGKVKLLRVAEIAEDRRIMLPPQFYKMYPELDGGNIVIGIFADEQNRQLIIKAVGRHKEEEIL